MSPDGRYLSKYIIGLYKYIYMQTLQSQYKYCISKSHTKIITIKGELQSF